MTVVNRHALYMKLLVLMAHYPVPPRTGSTIVAFNTIKELASRHVLDLICYGEQQQSEELDRMLQHIETVTPSRYEMRLRRVNQILWMFSGIPGWIAARASRSMNKRVAKVLDNNNYDAIIAFDLAAIQYLPKSYYVRCLANIEDPPSIKFARTRYLGVWSWFQKIKFLIYEYSARRYESQVIPRLGRVLVLSEEDMRTMIQESGYHNLGHVPYGVTLPCQADLLGFEGRMEGMIVVTGNMFHPPNVDGVLFFLREIFPLILIDFPDSRLWIVGNSPDPRIYAAASLFVSKIVITGGVLDVSNYLRRARVSVCPVRLRIGVQTKVLEALAWGTPVVTLSSGNSGIQGKNGDELWIEDDPVAFASRVVELLRGHAWDRLSANGRRLVEQRFSWKASALATEREIVAMNQGGK